MRRTLIRQVSVGVVVVAVAAGAASSAFAASTARGHHFGPRAGGLKGFGPMMGGLFAMRGPGGPGGHGFGPGGPGGPGGPRGGGVLGSDVLTPAAAYLGVSL